MSQAPAIWSFTASAGGGLLPAASASDGGFADLLSQGLHPAAPPASDPPRPRESADAVAVPPKNDGGENARTDADRSATDEVAQSTDESSEKSEKKTEKAHDAQQVAPHAGKATTETPKSSTDQPVGLPTAKGLSPSDEVPDANSSAEKAPAAQTGESSGSLKEANLPAGDVAESSASIPSPASAQSQSVPGQGKKQVAAGDGQGEDNKPRVATSAEEASAAVDNPRQVADQERQAGASSESTSQSGAPATPTPQDEEKTGDLRPKRQTIETEPKSRHEAGRDGATSTPRLEEAAAPRAQTAEGPGAKAPIDEADQGTVARDGERGDRRRDKTDDLLRRAPHQAAPASPAMLATDAAAAGDAGGRPVDAEAAPLEPVAPDPGPPRETNVQATSLSAPPTRRMDAVGAMERPSSGASVDAPDGSQLTSTQQARFVHRVAGAVAAAADRGGTLRLRLNPPELGGLKLEVRFSDAGLDVRMETETHAARTALLDNLPSLRDKLARQEVKIERFDVDLMDQRDSAPRDGRAQDFGRREAPRSSRLPVLERRLVAASPAAAWTSAVSDRVDLFA